MSDEQGFYSEICQDLDRLRVENARLVGEVESLKENVSYWVKKHSIECSFNAKVRADLQRHKQALEKAREWFYNIDVAVDDTCGSDLKQMCRDALRHIDEVLK